MKAGDTFWSIATAHGLTVDELKALNPGKDPDALVVSFFSVFTAQKHFRPVYWYFLAWTNTSFQEKMMIEEELTS